MIYSPSTLKSMSMLYSRYKSLFFSALAVLCWRVWGAEPAHGLHRLSENAKISAVDPPQLTAKHCNLETFVADYGESAAEKLILGQSIQAGAPQARRESQLGQPLFDIKPYQRLATTDDSLRVDIAIESANDLLQFVRRDGEFTATVDITLSIKDKKSNVVSLQTRTFRKSVAAYEETNARQKYFAAMFTNYLPAGDYELKTLLLDRESLRRESIDRQFNVVKIKRDFDLSDLMLTRSNRLDPVNRQPVDIAINGTTPDSSGNIYLFFDVLRNEPLQVATIYLTLLDQSGKQHTLDSLSIVGGDSISTYSLPIHCSDLSFGRYELIARAETGGRQVVRKTTFHINPFGLPASIPNIDQAIRQLRYIASTEEIQHLQRAFPSEREAGFIRFWNDNFPAGNEAVNGKMVEYYNRINYAIVNFSNARSGWETDRGRIYVLYGAPSEIESRSADVHSGTVEIWRYHHLNRQFVFQDEYGFGDYKLVSPMW